MGGKSKAQTVGFRYYFDIHMGLGLPLDEIVEIRASDKRAWRGSISENGQVRINAPNLFGGDKGEGGLDGTLDVMFGEEDQGVLTKLANMLGGIVPAFRGITTAFYSGLVTSMNPYPKTWEILRRGGNRLWGSEGAWYPEKQFVWLADNQIKAMNPAHILYLMYTGRRFRGLPRARMDDAAWRAAADTLHAEQFGLCLEWRRSETFKTFRDTVLAHTGAEVYLDRRTALISIRLLRDDYDPASLPLFDEDSGLLEVTQEEAASGDSVPSQIVGKYVDAITGETRTVRAVNAAVAQRAGGRSSEEVEYFGAPTAEIAGRLIQRDLRIKTSGLKRFKVVLDRRGRNISPGQPFRIRSLRRGIDALVVRAGRIEDGTLDDGKITITALQDVFGLPASSYVTAAPAGWEPPDRSPQAIATRRLLEVPYRELAGLIDPANLALLDPTTAYLAALAVAPTSLSQSYTLTDRVGSSGDFVARESGDWCPSGLLAAAIAPTLAPVSVTLTSASRLDEVIVGMAALLDDEIVRVDAVDYASGVVTLARGCADTVPAAHSAGARVWFYDGFEGWDETAYTAGVTLQARLLTNTSVGQLDPALAATDSLTLHGRQGRPYPPGNVRINGIAHPAAINGLIDLTWAHRDRLLQADQLIDTAQGSIGPETGVTYSARMLRVDTQAVLASQSGLSGTAATLSAPYDGQVIVELWSVRGGLESWHRHRYQLAYSGDLAVSLLHFDGANGSTSFVDARGKVWTAYDGAAITTEYSVFGGASGRFANAGYISTPAHADFNFGTGDFTIAFRLRLRSLTRSFGTVIATGHTGWMSGCTYIMVPSSLGGKITVGGFSQKSNSGYEPAGNPLLTSTTALALGTFYHVEVCKKGNTLYLFINGNLEATNTSTAYWNLAANGTLLGRNLWDGPNGLLDAEIDEFMARKGEALHTANFTPPAGPYS